MFLTLIYVFDVSTLPFLSLIARVERALGVVHIRGNQLRIRDAALPQRLLHRLHDDDALLPGQRGALQLAVAQAPSALVRLPEHAVAPVVARRVRGLGAVDRLGLAVLLDHSVLGRPVGRGEDLDFSLGSLDSDGRDDVLGVGVCAHGRRGDADAVVAGEAADDGRVLVCTGGVLVAGSNHGWGLLVLLWL